MRTSNDCSALLYGLALARKPARDAGEAIVAEGYMDVIALHRAGFENAVAPLGTALSETQIRELWRLAPEPVICFDGDAAGRGAAYRAVERALPLLFNNEPLGGGLPEPLRLIVGDWLNPAGEVDTLAHSVSPPSFFTPRANGVGPPAGC